MNTSGNLPGQEKATASLVLGIVAVICLVFVSFPFISLVLSIVGLVMSSQAKKEGYVGGMQTAGFVLSMVALVLGVIFFLSCVSCIGCIGCRS